MDYALSLQDTPYDDLPPLPALEVAPDVADLRDCLSAGRFLLVVAGDTLDPRAIRLSKALFTGHLTSEWDLAMIDLNVYRSKAPDEHRTPLPELRGMVVAETRQVVRVQVEGATPRAHISVERIPSDDSARPRLASVDEFLEYVRQRALNAEAPVAKIVERFRHIESATDGRFVLGLQAATANLYWRLGTGALRRVFSMNENGRFKVWLNYVLSEGRDDVATAIRELSRPVVTIAPGETSGALFVNQSNVEGILSMIEEVATVVTQMGR